MINLIYQHYTSGNQDRDREFEICREKNDEAGLKLWPIIGQKRITFREMFLYGNHVSEPGDKIVIANSDIYFLPETVKQIEALNLGGYCLALSRWDLLADGSIEHYDHADSQDCFVFEAPINIPKGLDFSPGVPGCDNRLCFLFKQSGYKVINPSKDVKTVHVHLTGLRTYNANTERIQPPYYTIQPTFLGRYFK